MLNTVDQSCATWNIISSSILPVFQTTHSFELIIVGFYNGYNRKNCCSLTQIKMNRSVTLNTSDIPMIPIDFTELFYDFLNLQKKCILLTFFDMFCQIYCILKSLTMQSNLTCPKNVWRHWHRNSKPAYIILQSNCQYSDYSLTWHLQKTLEKP